VHNSRQEDRSFYGEHGKIEEQDVRTAAFGTVYCAGKRDCIRRPARGKRVVKKIGVSGKASRPVRVGETVSVLV